MLSGTGERSHGHTVLQVAFSNSFGLASARPTPQGLSGAPKDFLSKLLVLTESEKEYVREFNDKKYIPELLFEDKEMVNRIKFHPMALWKTRSRCMFFL